MAAAASAAAAAAGRRLLAEIDETNLEDLLCLLRTRAAAAPAASQPRPTTADANTSANATVTPVAATNLAVPALDRIVAAHFRDTRSPGLDIAGPHALPLLYLLAATAVAPPRRQAIVVVDLEARFDTAVLRGLRVRILPDEASTAESIAELSEPVSADDLRHVHVFRVDPRQLASIADVVAAAHQRVLYGPQRLRDRPCCGALVLGSAAATDRSVLARSGFYGWLHVDATPPSARQALHQPPDPITWTASSPWGSFTFQLLQESES